MSAYIHYRKISTFFSFFTVLLGLFMACNLMFIKEKKSIIYEYNIYNIYIYLGTK